MAIEKLETAVFLKWVKKHDWLKINDIGTQNGIQENYVTPAGEFVIAQYNLSKELTQLIKPMPAPQGIPMQGFPMQNILRGGKFPGGPG